MNPADRIVMCSQAVMRFYGALDAGDIEGVAGWMAPEGIWHRQGQVLRGPSEVLAALKQRPAGRVTAHLVNNLVIDLDDARGLATARYMLMVFRHDRSQPGEGPVPITGSLLSITETTDLWCELPGAGWRALNKQGRALFTRQG
ncbi:MAG: nuclear transport factor 2 family protein [Burkholderiaceae bacterium]